MHILLIYLAIATIAVFGVITILKILEIKLRTTDKPLRSKNSIEYAIQQWKDCILRCQTLENSISSLGNKVKSVSPLEINKKFSLGNSNKNLAINLSNNSSSVLNIEEKQLKALNEKVERLQKQNTLLKEQLMKHKQQLKFLDENQRLSHRNQYKNSIKTPQSKRSPSNYNENIYITNSQEKSKISQLNKKLQVAYENQQLYNAEIQKLQQRFQQQKLKNSKFIQELQQQVNLLKEKVNSTLALEKENNFLKQQVRMLSLPSTNTHGTLRVSNSSELLSRVGHAEKSCIDSFQPKGFNKKQDFLKDCRFILLDQRNFILNKLKQYSIDYESAQLLFRFDHHKLLSPFQTIKGVQNLLLVLELLNGKALAVYTHFHDITKSNQSLILIFDLTKEKLYWSDNQQVKIQPGILMWGNQIMKIRSSQPKMLVCKLAGSNFLGAEKLSQQQFLGTFRQWTQINKYEFYKINMK